MFSYFQRLGKALMMPIAVLPAAALLLGGGYFIQNQIEAPVTSIQGTEERIINEESFIILSSDKDSIVKEKRDDGSYIITDLVTREEVAVINAGPDATLGTIDDIILTSTTFTSASYPSPIVTEEQSTLDKILNGIQLFLQKAGGALIDNMGLLFAIGVAYGLSKDGSGAAALAAIVSWLVVQNIAGGSDGSFLKALSETGDIITADYLIPFGKLENQFVGILIGALTAAVYNKTYKIELPQALSFFSGRRLSLIATAVMSLFL